MIGPMIGRSFGRRSFASWVLLGSIALALPACGPSREDSAELHYRLTVEVETPQGPRSGSSVIAVKAVRNPDWVNPEGRGNRAIFRGEAVAVDLPSGKTLFALMKTDGGASEASDYPWLAFQDKLREKDDLVASYQRLGRSSASAPMPRTEMTLPNGGTEVSALPMLVTFKDIKDPTSVARVDPDDLVASFGAGVKLKAITVQVTDDPATTGIRKRFSWWNKYSLERRRLNGSNSIAISTNELSDNLGTGEFSTGVNQ